MVKQTHKTKSVAVRRPLLTMGSYTVLSGLLLVFFPVDSLPLSVRVQISPLASLLSLLFLPFIATRFHLTPLFKVVLLFAVFILLHSVVALFVDVTILGESEIRVLAWARQVIALIVGLSVFFVLRKTLLHVSDRFIIYAVVAGALPALTLAFLNILWGLTDNVLAREIVTTVRTSLVPLGWTGPQRASGLSLEPSTFAVYLAIVVIPVLLMMLQSSRSRMVVVGLLLLGIVLGALSWTFSSVGFAVVLIMLLLGILLGPKRTLLALLMVSFAGNLTLWIYLFPENYMTYQIISNLQEQYTASFVDRFYSTIGPLLGAFSSYTLLSYGLGGTVSHITEILPESIASTIIMEARWEGMPMLGTLVGRIFAETGIFGLSLFILIVLVSLWEAQIALRRANNRSKEFFIQSARLALLGTLIAHSITLGSFAFPYLWFWLAIIDSRYILSTKTNESNAS